MKRFWIGLIVVLSAIMVFWELNVSGEAKPGESKALQPEGTKTEEASAQSSGVTIQADKTSLENGGTITVSGTAPAGQAVSLEIWSDAKIRASRFDSETDKTTGQRPYILYLTEDMPAYYRIIVPKEQKGNLDKIKKEGRSWSLGKALKDLGAEKAYSVPAQVKIDRYQATLMGSVVGSRGDLLPAMDGKENRQRSLQVLKARARKVEKILEAKVEGKNPGGKFQAALEIPSGFAPGRYNIMAVTDQGVRSQAVVFENHIHFPNIYLSNAGTSLNLFGPFFLSLAIAVFGVLMGAGGGFILNPLAVSLWPLPHTVVAGTVMPTVLFSQGSGILNYSKIKFINWKLGFAIGLAMLAGGFIGPKLTELITLEQFKFVFGWILLVLAALMFWQTTPGYLAKNKKEQAILKEFKKRAEDSAKKKSS